MEFKNVYDQRLYLMRVIAEYPEGTPYLTMGAYLKWAANTLTGLTARLQNQRHTIAKLQNQVDDLEAKKDLYKMAIDGARPQTPPAPLP